MQNSPALSLPYILPSQAQKHVTHNEALRMLDALVQACMESASLTAPPAQPADGKAYIVAEPAAGDWAGKEGQIAAFQDGAWRYFAPQAGWRVWVRDVEELRVFDGSMWRNPIARADRFGISADADATNRLSVSAPATLLNHAGNDHQLKINKNAGNDTASLLFQTGWSGRVEIGTAGDDNLSIKVSGDGSNFATALRVDNNTGIVDVPYGAHSGEAAIADDGFATIPVDRVSGLFLAWVTAASPHPDHSSTCALFFFDCGGSPNGTSIFLASDIGTLETGAPDGTTGDDGTATFFVDEGAIHIENRRGSTRTFRWMLLA